MLTLASSPSAPATLNAGVCGARAEDPHPHPHPGRAGPLGAGSEALAGSLRPGAGGVRTMDSRAAGSREQLGAGGVPLRHLPPLSLVSLLIEAGRSRVCLRGEKPGAAEVLKVWAWAGSRGWQTRWQGD